MSGSMSFDNLSSLSLMRTSESFSDLNAELSGATTTSNRAPARSSLASLRSTAATAAQTSLTNPTAIGSAAAEECNNNNNKPFGLGETKKNRFLSMSKFKDSKG